MVTGLEAARAAAKMALEGMYEGRATVIEHRKATDGASRLTSYVDEAVFTDVPCRVAFQRLSAAAQGESAAANQPVKLFLSPDVEVKPNSKIAVSQGGAVMEYAMSGVPAVYDTHQEVLLERFRGWA